MTDYLEAKSIALIFLGLTLLAISFAAYRLKSKIRDAERKQSEMGSRLTFGWPI